MKSQIFKKKIPIDILQDFLREFAEDKNNYYLFTNVSFNKAKFHKKIDIFCDSIKDYYYASKSYYVTRKMTYNNFTTVLRQICKAHLVTYTSKIKYEKSAYDIEYYIYK